MALTIDSTSLAQVYARWVDRFVSPRYCVFRTCAYATVINDSSLAERVWRARAVDLATREALEWQADQDEDLDEAEVIHHLQQQAKSSPVFQNVFSQTERSDAITTLVTSCSFQSPTLFTSARGRPLSSFRRLSIRQSMRAGGVGFRYVDVSNLEKLITNLPVWKRSLFPLAPEIVGESLLRTPRYVVWHLQFDIVDLLNTRSPGKRKRTTINPFHQVPAPLEEDAAPRNHPPEAKRFKGVRYRPERKKWVAEMKPPNSKKVSFGEFKSQAQAARAIDAAFHYYDKPHLLNFPDTPGILSTGLSLAEILNEEDLLNFVKEQVKWLASMASRLPSSPPSTPPEIPQSSSRGCIGDALGFRTVSEIASFLGVADESDDGISQRLPSLPPDALAELSGGASMEPSFAGADAAGGIMGSLSIIEWSSENAFVAQSSPGSSVQITDGWDGVEVSGAPALMNMANSVEPSSKSPGSWMNYLAMSPSASMLPVPCRSPSPTSFDVDVTHGLLESESFGGGGEWLRG